MKVQLFLFLVALPSAFLGAANAAVDQRPWRCSAAGVNPHVPPSVALVRGQGLSTNQGMAQSQAISQCRSKGGANCRIESCVR